MFQEGTEGTTGRYPTFPGGRAVPVDWLFWGVGGVGRPREGRPQTSSLASMGELTWKVLAVMPHHQGGTTLPRRGKEGEVKSGLGGLRGMEGCNGAWGGGG